MYLYKIIPPSCPCTRSFTIQEVRVTGLSYALLFLITDIIRATALLFTALMILPIVKDLPWKSTWHLQLSFRWTVYSFLTHFPHMDFFYLNSNIFCNCLYISFKFFTIHICYWVSWYLKDSLCMISVVKIFEENRKCDFYYNEMKCFKVSVPMIWINWLRERKEPEIDKIEWF